MKAKKLILVTSESHPSHKPFLKVLEELSKELNIEKEIKNEDYAFLADYGEKDEFGATFLPQLFIETEDGKIIPVLTQMPFNPQKLEPDPEEGKKQALEKIKNVLAQ